MREGWLGRVWRVCVVYDGGGERVECGWIWKLDALTLCAWTQIIIENFRPLTHATYHHLVPHHLSQRQVYGLQGLFI